MPTRRKKGRGGNVCPDHIRITDNGTIPLKERVVDEFYDPLLWVWRKLFGGGKDPARKSKPNPNDSQGAKKLLR